MRITPNTHTQKLWQRSQRTLAILAMILFALGSILAGTVDYALLSV